MTHQLKTWTWFFQAIVDGKKPWEIRFNDRDFKVGDILILREFDPERNSYTGKILKRQVEYIYSSAYGLEKGYVIMTLSEIQN